MLAPECYSVFFSSFLLLWSTVSSYFFIYSLNCGPEHEKKKEKDYLSSTQLTFHFFFCMTWTNKFLNISFSLRSSRSWQRKNKESECLAVRFPNFLFYPGHDSFISYVLYDGQDKEKMETRPEHFLGLIRHARSAHIWMWWRIPGNVQRLRD